MTTNKNNLSTKRSLAVAIAALGLGMAGIAGAQPGEHRGRGMSEQCKAQHFQQYGKPYDTNRDGRLDQHERRAMHEARRAANLSQFDADGDGKLNDSERKNMRHAKRVEHFETLDKDRNAAISGDEARGSCTPLAHHFDRADKDGDGQVSWAEFEAGAKEHARRGRGNRRRGASERAQ